MISMAVTRRFLALLLLPWMGFEKSNFLTKGRGKGRSRIASKDKLFDRCRTTGYMRLQYIHMFCLALAVTRKQDDVFRKNMEVTLGERSDLLSGC